MDGKHGHTMSGVPYHLFLWTVHTVERRRAWHAIIAFGKNTRSNDVGRGMTSLPLDNTHGRQRQAWHDITALGLHTQSATSGVACHQRLWTVHTVSNDGRGITSPPLGSTHGRTTSHVACDHSPWTANTVKRRQGWHATITFGQHKWSNDVRRDMPS